MVEALGGPNQKETKVKGPIQPQECPSFKSWKEYIQQDGRKGHEKAAIKLVI